LLEKCFKLHSVAQFTFLIKLQSALVNAKNTSNDIRLLSKEAFLLILGNFLTAKLKVAKKKCLEKFFGSNMTTISSYMTLC
jgi:hypothetical protein